MMKMMMMASAVVGRGGDTAPQALKRKAKGKKRAS